MGRTGAFLVAGALLLLFADAAPKAAAATTGAILVGVLLTHPQEIQAIADSLNAAMKR